MFLGGWSPMKCFVNPNVAGFGGGRDGGRRLLAGYQSSVGSEARLVGWRAVLRKYPVENTLATVVAVCNMFEFFFRQITALFRQVLQSILIDVRGHGLYADLLSEESSSLSVLSATRKL
jgi:hypothetical protein